MQVEYIDETHTYLVDGKEVPSVTRIVAYKLGNIYKDVPKDVLQKKAEYGTYIHSLIQEYEETHKPMSEIYQGHDLDVLLALDEYRVIKQRKTISIKETERIVFNERCAGRFDMITNNDEILDIKTTYRYDPEYLSWQIGLYYYLAGIRKSFGGCIWLPKGKRGEYIDVHVHSHEECEALINDFFQQKV